MRADVRDMRILSTYAHVFAELRYDSDTFWEFLTDIVSNNFAGLPWPEKVDIMRSYSRAKRGSNELWNYFIDNSLIEKGIDDLERDIALTAFIGEAELPKEIISGYRFDPSQLASSINNILAGKPHMMVSSSNCEDLAFLILFHPWVTNEEAQIFENLLRNSYKYIYMESTNRINQMYDRVKRNKALKTIGIDDLQTN